MRTYIISGTNVRVVARRPAKLAKGDRAVATVEELSASRLPAKRLAAIWNALPGTKKATKLPERAV